MYKILKDNTKLNLDIINIVCSYNIQFEIILQNKKELLNQLFELNFKSRKLNDIRKVELKKRLFVKLYRGTKYIHEDEFFNKTEVKLVGDWKDKYDELKYHKIYTSPKSKYKLIKSINFVHDKETRLKYITNYINNLKDLQLNNLKENLEWLKSKFYEYEHSYEREHGDPDNIDILYYGLGDSKIANELTNEVSLRTLRRIDEFDSLDE